MIGYVVAGAALTALYQLVVKGYLWKFLILIAGCYGMWHFLSTQIISSNTILVSVLGFTFSWAVCIAAVITLLALITSRMEQ